MRPEVSYKEDVWPQVAADGQVLGLPKNWHLHLIPFQ